MFLLEELRHDDILNFRDYEMLMDSYVVANLEKTNVVLDSQRLFGLLPDMILRLFGQFSEVRLLND